MGTDFNNRAAMNWGPIQTPNQQAAQQNAINSVDQKQKPLVRAIASLIQAASADLYASNEDRKYRYIVDLILDRVRAALNTQLSDLSDTQLEAVSKQNEALLKAISTSTSGIVESAFSKLGVTLDKKQADDILDQFNDKLDAAIASLKDQIEKGQFSTSSSKKSSGEDDAATKSDQLETIKSIDALKKQLAKQFSADRSSNTAPATSSGKKAFKAASALVISKQLSALAKNQKIINQSMTKRFEKTTKTISGGVERLHDTTSNNFYNLNDKLEDSMAKLGRQTKRISAGIVAGVVGAVAAITVGIKKTFGAVFSGLKAISGGLFRLFKKPAGVVGDLLKNLIATPGGMFAIGWIAGYVWKKWLKPLWDWAKPIRDAIGEWFGGKLSFKDMIGKVWSHLKGGILQIIDGVRKWFSDNWETISNTISNIWNQTKDFASKTWDYISPHLDKFWKWLKPYLKEALNLALKGLKKIWNWFLDFNFGTAPIFGPITGKKILIALATYLAMKGVTKVINLVGSIINIVKGISKGVGAISKAIKALGSFLGFGGKAAKVARATAAATKAAKVAQAAAKAGKTAKAAKAAKQAADAAKKARDLAKAAKAGKDAAKAAKIAKEAQQATLAAARAAKAAKAASTAGKAVAKTAGVIAGKTALKTAGKVAGGALVAVDAAMDIYDMAGAIKKGDYGKAVTKGGFATAKAASLATGPLAPVAFGAIMAAEAVAGKIDESSQAFEEAVTEMNERTQAGMKSLNDIYAQKKKDDASKTNIDKLLEKIQKYDQTKAEYDPLKKKRDEISKKLKEAQESTFSWMKGKQIKELLAQEDALNQQLSEMTAKSGLSDWELQHDKNRILESRSSGYLLKQMSPEMQARFKQIMAEQTKIGPDNMKFLPDMQKVLEQLKQEYEGGGPVTEKVDQVGDNVERVKQLQQQQLEQQRQMFEYMKQHPNGQPLTIVNAPQVQAQERSFTTMDK